MRDYCLTCTPLQSIIRRTIIDLSNFVLYFELSSLDCYTLTLPAQTSTLTCIYPKQCVSVSRVSSHNVQSTKANGKPDAFVN